MCTKAAACSKPLNKVALILTFGALGAFAPFATDMYLASFPAIARSLDTSIGEVQYSVSTFFIGLSLGQLFYAPLIDRFGRRLPLILGVALFTMSALLAAFSPNIESFIGLRVLQALGGCSGMIISRAIIRDLFDTSESARVLSMMMMVQGIGPIAAPILGGYLYTFLGWQSVFIFLSIFGGGCLLATIKNVPETLDAPRSISPSDIGKNFKQLLMDRRFMVPLVSGSFALSTMFAFISGSPFVFMELYGVTAEHYSWLFGIFASGMLVAAQINALLLKRFSPGTIFHGILVLLVLFSSLLTVFSRTENMWIFGLPLFFCIATVPITGANATALAMAASGKNSGTASSLVGVTQFLGAGLISGLVGLLHNETAYPMTLTILGVSVAALITYQFRVKSAP